MRRLRQRRTIQINDSDMNKILARVLLTATCSHSSLTSRFFFDSDDFRIFGSCECDVMRTIDFSYVFVHVRFSFELLMRFGMKCLMCKYM